MTLFDESIHGLRARVRNLEGDLEHWRLRTQPPPKPGDPHDPDALPPGDLPLHHSQMRRLHEQILGTLDVVYESGAPFARDVAPPFEGSVKNVDMWRRGVGSVHLIWDFFHDKLSQRDVEAYRLHLDAADDLAWACYRPFHEAALDVEGLAFEPELVKEPPLVFYGTDRTPFTQARSKMMQPHGLDSKDTLRFQEALHRLPVPVISVPWSLADRVPELVLVGHETGHIVAEDLGLAVDITATLESLDLVGDADGARRTVWTAWGDEVWADVFGVVATGRSFVAGLCLELADDPTAIRSSSIDAAKPGKYPSPALRVAICERVLERLGVARDATWHDTYGIIVGDSRAYEADVAVVADALFDRAWPTLGDQTLADLLPWSSEHEDDVATVSKAALGGFDAGIHFDVRIWTAAAMHAHRTQPAAYLAKDLDQELAQFIANRRQDVVRSADREKRATAVAQRLALPDGTRDIVVDPASIDSSTVDRALDDIDRRAGRAIADLLGIG